MPLEHVDWSPLSDLALRQRLGRIKVTTTSRLLAYAEMRDSLEWTVQSDGGDVDIRIAPPQNADSLQGMTFYVPDARHAAVSVGGDRLDVERNPPDETGRESVSVPWRAMRYPLPAMTADALTGARA
jgi:hypothetical protein